MKVLMLGWEFPPHITGGLGTACYGLTKGLAKNNVQVLFLVPKAYGDEDESAARLINASSIPVAYQQDQWDEFWKNITYMEIGSNLVPYVGQEEYQKLIEQREKGQIRGGTGIFSRYFDFSGKYGRDLMDETSRYALVAATIATKEKFDVIHAHDWLTYPAGIAARAVSGKPLVIHVHATEFDRSGENINQGVYDMERKGMTEADLVVTVSNFTRNIVINRYGIDPGKVFTVHNAVDHGFRDFNGTGKSIKEKLVTFLGRVTFQKGPDYFVEAAAKVLKKDDNVRFVMAGSGDMLERMVRRAGELRIGSKFHFTGFLQGDDVNRLFSMSDVYVMPSVSEPFGISPLEAMRSSVPVIISKQSGVSEVLKHAIKLDFWDIDAIADAIYGILHYGALSRMFIKYGKEEVENLKWENAAFLVNELYHNVTAKYTA